MGQNRSWGKRTKVYWSQLGSDNLYLPREYENMYNLQEQLKILSTSGWTFPSAPDFCNARGSTPTAFASTEEHSALLHLAGSQVSLAAATWTVACNMQGVGAGEGQEGYAATTKRHINPQQQPRTPSCHRISMPRACHHTAHITYWHNRASRTQLAATSEG